MPWNLGLVWDPITCLAPFSVTNLTGVTGWTHAIWDGTRYIVFDDTGVGVSYDHGVTWNFTSTPGFINTSNAECIASNGSRLVTCGRLFTEEIFTSDDDGVSWTSRATLTDFEFPDVFNAREILNITSDGNGFVLCGRSVTASSANVYYSPDGISWSGTYVGPVSVGTNLSAVRHMNNAYYMAGVNLGSLILRKSVTGGSTWTTLTPPPSLVVQFPFLWAVNGQLIMKTREVSDLEPMRLWTSSNEGASWTEITTGLYDVIHLDWVDDTWIVVTDLGTVFTGPTLDSLIVYPTLGEPNILAASNTNFILDVVASPTGSIRVIDLDCDGEYGIPFIFYNVQEMDAGLTFTNDGTAGGIFDVVRLSTPPSFRWIFLNENRPVNFPDNTGGPYPQYQEDFGGTDWLSNNPLSVIFAFDMPDDPSRQIYTYTEHYVYGENWDGFLMYAELSVEEDWLYFNLNLWDSVFPGNVTNESSIYCEGDWFTSLIVPGRNVIGITVWPVSGTNYVLFNSTHSESFPTDPPPSPYTFIFNQTVQDPELAPVIATGNGYHGTAEYPAPYSESNIDIEDFVDSTRVKVEGLKAVAFTRTAITADDIDFWANVDLSTLPTF
jgi:hypothetical protein